MSVLRPRPPEYTSVCPPQRRLTAQAPSKCPTGVSVTCTSPTRAALPGAQDCSRAIARFALFTVYSGSAGWWREKP